MWAYGLVDYENPIVAKEVNEKLFEETLGSHWDERCSLVTNLYADLPRLEAPGFTTHRLLHDDLNCTMPLDCTQDELIGYIRSWSGYNSYCQEKQIQAKSQDDPAQQLADILEKENIHVIRGRYPLVVLLSRKDA